jgi:hypothetical protein
MVVFGPFQTPLVQAFTKPSISQPPATTRREAQNGRVEKQSLFICLGVEFPVAAGWGIL